METRVATVAGSGGGGVMDAVKPTAIAEALYLTKHLSEMACEDHPQCTPRKSKKDSALPLPGEEVDGG